MNKEWEKMKEEVWMWERRRMIKCEEEKGRSPTGL